MSNARIISQKAEQIGDTHFETSLWFEKITDTFYIKQEVTKGDKRSHTDIIVLAASDLEWLHRATGEAIPMIPGYLRRPPSLPQSPPDQTTAGGPPS